MLVKSPLTLVAAAVALLTVACGGDDGAPEGEGGDIVVAPTTPNAVGGPCTVGTKKECKQTIAERDGIVSCYVGEQTCDASGVWGACLKQKKVDEERGNGKK